jgi:hypothetical protein
MLFAVGRSIREARKRQNVTQSEAAKAAGIGRSSLSQIENGAIQEIGIDPGSGFPRPGVDDAPQRRPADPGRIT